jgi:chemotaxis protein CheD
LNDKSPFDQLDRMNLSKDITLPIGHNIVINNDQNSQKTFPTISIYGLGSCIALILYDKDKSICGMSHILLPNSNGKSEIKFPHKYADLSVKTLINELILLGAEKKNIKAVIVGGSKILDLNDNIIGSQNIKSIKQELNSSKIKIEIEIVGGSKGRVIKLIPNESVVYVKSTGDKNFDKFKI